MDGGDYRPIMPPKANFAKMMLFMCNAFFFCLGAGLLALGLYVQIDHGYQSDIVGSMLYLLATVLSICVGFIIMFLSFFGCWSAYSQQRSNLIFFLVIVVVLAILVFGSALLAVLFRSTMIQSAKDSMEYSLKRHFGKTRLITEAWSLTQTNLRCCGVENNGWSVYNNSEWDIIVNADARFQDTKIPYWSPLYKFVPDSCCLRLLDPRTLLPSQNLRSLQQCQYWPFGPPNKMQGGFNDALYYRGCYEAGVEFLSSHTRFYAGLAFMLFIVTVSSIVCTVILISNTSDDMVEARRAARKTHVKLEPPLLPPPAAAVGYGYQ